MLIRWELPGVTTSSATVVPELRLRLARSHQRVAGGASGTGAYPLERAPYAPLSSRIQVRVALKSVVERERFPQLIAYALKSAGCQCTLPADSGMEILRQAPKELPRPSGPGCHGPRAQWVPCPAARASGRSAAGTCSVLLEAVVALMRDLHWGRCCAAGSGLPRARPCVKGAVCDQARSVVDERDEMRLGASPLVRHARSVHHVAVPDGACELGGEASPRSWPIRPAATGRAAAARCTVHRRARQALARDAAGVLRAGARSGALSRAGSPPWLQGSPPAAAATASTNREPMVQLTKNIETLIEEGGEITIGKALSSLHLSASR